MYIITQDTNIYIVCTGYILYYYIFIPIASLFPVPYTHNRLQILETRTKAEHLKTAHDNWNSRLLRLQQPFRLTLSPCSINFLSVSVLSAKWGFSSFKTTFITAGFKSDFILVAVAAGYIILYMYTGVDRSIGKMRFSQ